MQRAYVVQPRAALRSARDGVKKLPLVVGGLAEEQGAQARDRWTGVLEAGVLAGLDVEDPAEVSYFLESSRAGAPAAARVGVLRSMLERAEGALYEREAHERALVERVVGSHVGVPELCRLLEEARAAAVEQQRKAGRLEELIEQLTESNASLQRKLWQRAAAA